jgi:hypothetical protein
MTHLASYCHRVFSLLLMLLLAALAGSGCASTESANMSERPWNEPQSWESGMGSMFNQNR